MGDPAPTPNSARNYGSPSEPCPLHGDADVKVLVGNESNRPLDGIVVKVTDAQGTSRTATTAKGGVASFKGLCAGAATLTTDLDESQAKELTPLSAPVTIRKGKTVQSALKLKHRRPPPLTDAQLEKVRNLIAAGRGSRLDPPANTDDDSNPANLAARMSSIATDARFKGVGIGVIDFTASPPKVWLQNGDLAFRLASTGKLAMLLSAMQLRADVRAVKTALGDIPDPPDETFASIMGAINDVHFEKVAQTGVHAPRISTIFDLSAAKPDFRGVGDHLKHNHLGWSQAKDVSFWERMTMAGAISDNTAAASCISQIGITYMKAVQRFYGLFDPPNGMQMLLASGYGDPPGASFSEIPEASSPKFRHMDAMESQKVVDVLTETVNGKTTTSTSSTQGGSAASLTAYMLALVKKTLIDAEASADIVKHLTPITFSNACLTFDGVQRSATLTGGFAKVGILGAIRTEFAYVEARGKKFAVLATGLRGKPRLTMVEQGRALGQAVFDAL
jgi:hypothetical protein